MRRALLAAATWFVAWPLVAQAPAPAPADSVAARPAAATQGAGSKVWVGRYAEFEEFLRTAPIERVTDVPVGVTKPKRAFFAPGGLGRERGGEAPPDGPAHRASGRPTSRRSPPTSSTACSASTWSHRRWSAA